MLVVLQMRVQRWTYRRSTRKLATSKALIKDESTRLHFSRSLGNSCCYPVRPVSEAQSQGRGKLIKTGWRCRKERRRAKNVVLNARVPLVKRPRDPWLGASSSNGNRTLQACIFWLNITRTSQTLFHLLRTLRDINHDAECHQ